jgi:hypothetical protein
MSAKSWPRLWPLILLYVLIRNQLFLKPIAWGALRAARRKIESLGYRPKRVYLSIGLAEPEVLSGSVIFSTDAELISFRAARHQDSVVKAFRERLAQSLYPRKAVAMISFGFHSHEEILRKGGYHRYFN